MATTAHHPRSGSGCLWPRAWLCLQTGAPLPGSLAERLRELDPDIRPGGGETLLDITHAQREHGPPERIAARVAGLLGGATGPSGRVAIGVAATAWVARHAARSLDRGIAVIAPWELCQRLQDVPLAAAAPLDRLLALQLAHARVRCCGDLAGLPLATVTRRFGAAGHRLWSAVLGREPIERELHRLPHRALAITKVLPPRTLSQRTLETYLRTICRKLGARLRRHDLRAARLQLRMRYTASVPDFDSQLLPGDSRPDGDHLYRLALARFRHGWSGQAVARLQLVALDLENASGQLELFPDEELGGLHPPPSLDEWSGGSTGSEAPPAPAPGTMQVRIGHRGSPPHPSPGPLHAA